MIFEYDNNCFNFCHDNSIEIEPYKQLFRLGRWQDLVLQFRRENYRLLQLPQQSVLSVTVQAGLSALKTPQCYSVTGRVASCPVCSEPLNSLAACLPHAHCSQSRLVCRISGEPLNENNLPMMLPNGQVYGEKVINIIPSVGLPDVTDDDISRRLLMDTYLKLTCYVTLLQALKEMMKEQGAIICPKTKEVFCMKRVEKVYVM